MPKETEPSTRLTRERIAKLLDAYRKNGTQGLKDLRKREDLEEETETRKDEDQR